MERRARLAPPLTPAAPLHGKGKQRGGAAACARGAASWLRSLPREQQEYVASWACHLDTHYPFVGVLGDDEDDDDRR